MWPRPDGELELAAAVHPDAALLAVVVEREQLAQRPEARGLDVDHLRRERQRLDVGDRVDVRVPGHAVAVTAAGSSVSGVSFGSSIQASGKASATRR